MEPARGWRGAAGERRVPGPRSAAARRSRRRLRPPRCRLRGCGRREAARRREARVPVLTRAPAAAVTVLPTPTCREAVSACFPHARAGARTRVQQVGRSRACNTWRSSLARRVWGVQTHRGVSACDTRGQPQAPPRHERKPPPRDSSAPRGLRRPRCRAGRGRGTSRVPELRVPTGGGVRGGARRPAVSGPRPAGGRPADRDGPRRRPPPARDAPDSAVARPP